MFVAECEQCGVLERGDREEVGDAVEDHEQFHDVRISRAIADGGRDERYYVECAGSVVAGPFRSRFAALVAARRRGPDCSVGSGPTPEAIVWPDDEDDDSMGVVGYAGP